MKNHHRIIVALAWEEDKSAFYRSKQNHTENKDMGPVATASNSEAYPFDILCIINPNSGLFDENDSQKSFSGYVRWLQGKIGSTRKVKPYHFESNDEYKINDYTFLHDQLRHKIFKKIKKDFKSLEDNVQWFFLISSGPSESQLVWPLLAKSMKAIPLKINPYGHLMPANIPFDVSYNVKTEKASAPVGKTHPYLMTFHCDKMKKAAQYAQSIAPLPHSVLILGPNGTGKEMMARLIHDESGNTGAFIIVDCTGLPETLIESELFGSTKGAYTDAVDQAGMIEQAHNGTLFLDEIGDMPLTQQAKLLRVLQTKEVRRLKSDRTIPVNFRLISATNKDLAHEVEQGRFREDLYYRLNVLKIDLPPLYERGRQDIESIALLHMEIAEREIRNANKKGVSYPIIIPDDKHLTLSDEVKEILFTHCWPGNARELASTIKRAATHCVVVRGSQNFVIREEDINESLHVIIRKNSSQAGPSPIMTIDPTKHVNIEKILSAVEAKYCEAYLKQVGGVWKDAFELLGYGTYQTMQNRFNKARKVLEDDQN
ncbi:MAG: sigma 54-interacting transcriptional regulator [Proteobacteria bacterium]|nr:sigma 54-interacting transcriptional regulator [Pseudomonadota bacterium]